ncbi:hypothetical protein Y032_0335g2872 [Ancylostoma ceylanicum]|uniref:Uncharacterized protein n=1 Tax=Ancylostoma ceylanicum TaxID=53326 RepID=A0A016RZP5_9BILA|nr:hypothetical protein Y032_0335g2872 [Ancylostoma ceylanicum]
MFATVIDQNPCGGNFSALVTKLRNKTRARQKLKNCHPKHLELEAAQIMVITCAIFTCFFGAIMMKGYCIAIALRPTTSS